MRFDWYSASIRDDASQILDVLSAGLDADVRIGQAMHGYTLGHEFVSGGSVVARMLSGGRNGVPHAWASGDDTDAFVPVVRAAWPGAHAVTRMDAAEDFDGPGTWDRLYSASINLADERRLKVSQNGDWHRRVDGRTLYVGSRKSASFVRLYEKGKQINGRLPDLKNAASLDLTRLEVQVRPEGDSRARAAVGDPQDAFGYADWTRDLAKRVLDLDVDRVHIKERRESDLDRALGWMIRQYGEHLRAKAAELGGWEKFGLWVGGRLAEGDAERERRN